MPKDQSTPAFPSTPDHDAKYGSAEGMSLRDYFAGQALVGLATHAGPAANVIAACAYALADAMLLERAKD